MPSITETLKAEAEERICAETRAKLTYEGTIEARKAAVEEYNHALALDHVLPLGAILEAPHRYSWDRQLGKTEVLAVVGYSQRQMGKALGRVVTSKNKIHRGQKYRVEFPIKEATRLADRVLDAEDLERIK